MSCYNDARIATSLPPTIEVVQDPATWRVAAAPEPRPDGATLHLAVTRLGCANGVTGEVVDPSVLVEEDRVLIAATVEHRPEGGRCLANPEEHIALELPANALGKDLIDARCLAGSKAASTAACSLGPVRWHLPTVEGVSTVDDWIGPSEYTFQVTSLCGERAFAGTFDIRVSGDTVTSVTSLDGRSSDLAARDAMTIHDMLEEARMRLAGRGVVRLSLDAHGQPRYISVGDNLAQSDSASCYVIHTISAISPWR